MLRLEYATGTFPNFFPLLKKPLIRIGEEYACIPVTSLPPRISRRVTTVGCLTKTPPPILILSVGVKIGCWKTKDGRRGRSGTARRHGRVATACRCCFSDGPTEKQLASKMRTPPPSPAEGEMPSPGIRSLPHPMSRLSRRPPRHLPRRPVCHSPRASGN